MDCKNKIRSQTRSLPAMLLLVILTYSGIPETSTTQAESGQSSTAADYAAIDDHIRAQMDAWNIPGAALIIVQGEQTTHLQTYGRVITAHTPFEIGSCSKSFTALAVMQLVEAGKIELKAPVQQYLPWFSVSDAEASRSITIRHLLNHTSGISQSDSNNLTTPDPRGKSLEDQVRAMRKLRLNAEPGTTYQYSNLNYMALALVIEAVSGETYADYLHQYIFTPLEMTDSFTDPMEALREGYTGGHTWWFGYPFSSLEPPRPDMFGAGYIMVSPQDMSNYLIAQLNHGVYRGTRLVSDTGMALMHEPSRLTTGKSSYGMGWISYDEYGEAISDRWTVVNHNGKSASYTCSMIILPDQDTALAVMVSVSGMLQPHAAWSLAEKVMKFLVNGETLRVDNAFRNFYLPFDLGLLLASLAILGSIAALPRWGRKNKSSTNKKRLFLPFILDGLAGLFFLIGLPAIIGWGIWRGLFVWQPDAAYWCLAAGCLLLFKLPLRLLILASRAVPKAMAG